MRTVEIAVEALDPNGRQINKTLDLLERHEHREWERERQERVRLEREERFARDRALRELWRINQEIPDVADELARLRTRDAELRQELGL